MRLWRRRPPDPSTWACVAQPTAPRLPVWLGDVEELRRSAPIWPGSWTCDSSPMATGRPDHYGIVWRSCHGDGRCGHCGRQLPTVGVPAAASAADELRALLARVQRITPLGTEGRRRWADVGIWSIS